jgi:hypothetical protein
MFGSALFDADFLDAEAFFAPPAVHRRADWPTLGSLSPKLDAHLARTIAEADATPRQSSQGRSFCKLAEALRAARPACSRSRCRLAAERHCRHLLSRWSTRASMDCVG